MPSGPIHRKLTYTLLTLSLPLICYDPILATAFSLGVYVTIWVNPDMDLHVKGLWKYLGYGLYKEAIAHRAGLRPKNWKGTKPWELFGFSHLPYAGTLLRLLPLLLIWLILANAIMLSPYYILVPALAFFNGMGASDTIHVLADISVSEVHRQWK